MYQLLWKQQDFKRYNFCPLNAYYDLEREQNRDTNNYNISSKEYISINFGTTVGQKKVNLLLKGERFIQSSKLTFKRADEEGF